MAKIIDVLIMMVKYAFFVSLFCTFYLGATILTKYYEEHNDFKFTEKYEFKGDYTPSISDLPIEVQAKAHSLKVFQQVTYITLAFFFILEFLRYKRNPSEHWFYSLYKNLKKKSEIEDEI